MSKVSALMDYTKIQMDIIKDMSKNSRTNKYILGVDERNSTWHCIAIDGHAMVCIPDCMYMLDNSKVFYNQIARNFSSMLCEDGFKPLKLTTEMINDINNNITMNVFKDDDGNEYFVNTKLLEIFTKTGVNLHYTGIKYNAPIHVYSGHDLIGVVLPINYQRR